jgi:glycosyltransferase involved in cell wall biosynthesis
LGGSGDHRPLKILHIDPERNWGGGEAQVFGLLKHLADRGHHNDLLAHPRGVLFARCQALDVRARPFIMRNDLDLRCVLRLRRLIRRMAYDIVHFHTKRAHALALWLPRGNRRPRYVVTRRMDYPEPRTWYTSYLYNRRVDGVVAISQTIADVLCSAGVDSQKIRRIASGIDAEKFAAIGVRAVGAEGITEIGCLAALEKRKGHQYLLEAAALLKSQGLKIHCQIAGDGPLRAQLEADARRWGIDAEVRFLGFITDTAQFLAGVDLLAMPSLYEGLGVAALEAMAAGKPVVAAKVGGLGESIVDGITGFLVPPQNSDALAAAIAQLIRSPGLGASMGRRGRERVRQTFSLQTMARENESYYRELLSAPS